MTIDSRGRRAGEDFRRAIDDLRSSAPDRPSIARFERARVRKQRNRRIGATLLATGVTVAAIVFVGRVFGPVGRGTPAAPNLPGGLILYGDWDPQEQRADWYTVRPDGSERHDLAVTSTCAVWFPDGKEILVTDDAAARDEGPLRPAVVGPDGSDRRALDAARNPGLNLGCGDVSPDGRRIALEGFGEAGDHALDGIYSVRASDGGGLVRLVQGPVSPPRYSPDGTRLSFFDTKEGVSPSGSGALFVMRADGTDLRRITPWGYAFDDHDWSPDGEWIVFQRPYGQLYLVHPDGSGLHRIPIQLPAGAGGLNPTWSPDGKWIVFSLQRDERAEIHVLRPDGTDLRKVTGALGTQAQHPDWGRP
jgi:Tol biopolymer transport system component